MYLNPVQNRTMIKKIASMDPTIRMKAVAEIDKVLLEKAETTGIARNYFKGQVDTDTAGEGMRIVTQEDNFYDDKVTEKPGVMYYLQPDPDQELFGEKPTAVSIAPDGNLRILSFSGQRYTETFSLMETNPQYKEVNDLYVYPYDIVTYFENYNLKTLLDAEDVLFFKLQNKMLYEGRTAFKGMNIMVVNSDTFSVIQFSDFKDFHKEKKVPFSRLLSHFSILNEKERTLEDEIAGVSREGINGNTVMDNMFGMTPISLQERKYCYYSFDKANEDAQAEKNQFYIDLDQIPGRNVAELAALSEVIRNAAGVYIKNVMENLGYEFTAPSDPITTYGAAHTFCQYLDKDNFYPRIPITGAEYQESTGASGGKDIIAILGKTMMRNVILTPRAYFGHFDLFMEDAKTQVTRANKKIMFWAEEEMILTAKNIRAVSAMDIWKPAVPYSGS